MGSFMGTTRRRPEKAAIGKWVGEKAADEYLRILGEMDFSAGFESLTKSKVEPEKCRIWFKNMDKNRSTDLMCYDYNLVKVDGCPSLYNAATFADIPNLLLKTILSQMPSYDPQGAEWLWKTVHAHKVKVMQIFAAPDEHPQLDTLFKTDIGYFKVNGIHVRTLKVDKDVYGELGFNQNERPSDTDCFTVECFTEGDEEEPVVCKVYVNGYWQQKTPSKSIYFLFEAAQTVLQNPWAPDEAAMFISVEGARRSGCLLAAVVAMHEMNEGRVPNVESIVNNIRDQRPLAAADFDQYTNIYLLINLNIIYQEPMERTSSLRRKTSDGVLAKASNFGQMLEEVRKLALSKSLWDDEMQRDLPKKWEKHGDMIVFPQNTFTHINWRYVGRELWAVVAASLNVARVGRKRQIDDMRTAHVDLLYGADGWVDYVDERGIRFAYDTTVRVFDNAKKNEMKRISKWACQGQTIVDLYASLGYYSLTFLVSCEAKQVVAIDWNDEILESLIRSAQVNHVDDRLQVMCGDCRRVCPDQTADRVYLGLLPSCRAHWLTACKALKPEGGMIHINEILDMTTETKKKVETKSGEATDKTKKIVKEGETPKKKKVLRQKTLPVLSAVNENPIPEPQKLLSSEPQAPAETNGAAASEEVDGEQKKKKFTRSASIVEEMENRVLPEVKVWKEYENGGWGRLAEKHREFAKDCGQSCTRFLNNIHLSDVMYTVTVVNITRYGEVEKGKEHVVLELLCCQQDASAEHLISKFTSENLKT
ncbi:unnamed protein product [Caenorhabditis sp. 36 PRJEB53466]|nr:unnamed protein product [Caenorhabditis sp. 36 PRJEB53466]